MRGSPRRGASAAVASDALPAMGQAVSGSGQSWSCAVDGSRRARRCRVRMAEMLSARRGGSSASSSERGGGEADEGGAEEVGVSLRECAVVERVSSETKVVETKDEERCSSFEKVVDVLDGCSERQTPAKHVSSSRQELLGKKGQGKRQ